LKIEQFAQMVDGQVAQEWPGSQKYEIAALSGQATRFFWIRFAGLSVILYTAATLFLSLERHTPKFIKGCFFGMALCTVSSIISFLVSEWAFEQPKEIFMGVALGLIVIRMFNLLFAFAVGMFFLKFDGIGMAWGMLVMYFSYLTLEVAYVHKKGLLIGE